MIYGMVAGMLAIESVADIRTGTISVVRQIVFLVVAIILNVIMAYQSIWSILGGLFIGGIMFAYAFFTQEGIGYGDCLIFVTCGMYIGFLKNMRLLFGSLLIAAIAGIIVAIVKKTGIKARIPFVPCILTAYIVMSALGTLWR